MNASISDSLHTLAGLGADAFASTGLAADLSPTARRITRRRATRVIGTATAAALAVAALGASAFAVAGRSPVAPGVTPSPSPSISPSLADTSVVIPEGVSLEATFEQLSLATGIPVADFEAAAAQANLIGLPPEAGGSLEGWLWASTYQFAGDATAAEILSQMVASTVDSLDAQLVAPEDRLAVLTAASLVEREAKRDADRPKVARVIQNRLDLGMMLELDSTVHYVVGGESIFTSYEDRTVDNPYNTYLYKGLPPGPICSPGRASIDAVLNPAEGDWLYLVVVNFETGEARFAATFAEHVVNVEILRDWIADNGG